MEFETRVAGIPCICKVTYFSPGAPGRYSGPPEDCYPEEPVEFEFEILDSRGRPAEWLERKLTDQDSDRLCEEFLGMRAHS